MIERIVRLIRLDWSVFGELESDPNATTEAAIIVAVSTLLSAFGTALGSESSAYGFVAGLINGVVGWVVWAAVTYLVGRALFRGGGTFEQMLRLLGYASAPNVLGVFAFIPCLGWLAAFAGWLISLVAGVMAIREGLDVELGVAVAVVIVGAIAMGMLYVIVGMIFGGTMAILGGLLEAFGSP
jgi:hypothetical protein